MSIPVDIEALADAVSRYGPAGFLLTTGDDGRPHATQVTLRMQDANLRCGVGRRSTANARAQPKVSLLWPPADPAGYSLIVDGDMSVDDDGATIVPTHAVLHRQAPSEPGTSDCRPIDLGV